MYVKKELETTIGYKKNQREKVAGKTSTITPVTNSLTILFFSFGQVKFKKKKHLFLNTCAAAEAYNFFFDFRYVLFVVFLVFRIDSF